MEIATDEPVGRILAFDAETRATPRPVDLDAPFFRVHRPTYPECEHRQGVTLDMGTRKAHCRGCDVEIDLFDALLIYAHAETRLQDTRRRIEEERQREARQREARKHVKQVCSWEQLKSRHGKHYGWRLGLECGHTVELYRKTRAHKATCHECVRVATLAGQGVPTVSASTRTSTV